MGTLTQPTSYFSGGFVVDGKIQFDGGFSVNSNITDGSDLIWDSDNSEIPDSALGTIGNSTLANDTITISSGDGLSGGAGISLGSSTTLTVSVGSGIEIGNGGAVRLSDNSITINANDGLSGGGTVTLGSSADIGINVSDFAGSGLQDDGTQNLEVDPGTALEVGTELNVDPQDDERISWGTDDDINQYYNSANDDLRWEDNTNSSDRMALDRTTGNLDIEGSLNEGAAL